MRIVVASLLLTLPGLCFADAGMEDSRQGSVEFWKDVENWHHHHHHHHHHNKQPPAPAPAAAEDVEVDAQHAHHAAKVAKHAAKIANRVAAHSIKVTGHATKALNHALGALHEARVDTTGLSDEQKHTLKKAEGHLREATKTADFGKLKKIKDDEDLQKEKMQDDLDKSKTSKTEKEELLQEIEDIRKMLKDKNVEDKEINKALDDLEDELNKSDGASTDEVKAEIERLRELVDKMEAQPEEGKVEITLPKKKAANLKDIGMKPLKSNKKGTKAPTDISVTPIESKGIDIDTQMPFGDLEPFGREDTAQELTEKSIHESDAMVDQLERAEVAEEKRSVFRALTRLRGAAITSYDGVARSQTGNIDEYNKANQWRKGHPLHHLADEESDVTKWAFPENADMPLQTKKKGFK